MPKNRALLPRPLKIVAALVAALAVASCGGGADSPAEAGAVQFATQMRALAGPLPPPEFAHMNTAPVTGDMVIDWAEFKFPELFPKAVGVRFPSVVVDGVTYNARAYPGSWGIRYLGITPDGRVFGLGDFTNNGLQQFESIGFWSAQVQAEQCAVNPASCTPGTNTPAGALNGCTLPAAQALASGSRLLATYAISISGSSGQYTVDSLVEGPASFEGQAVVRTRELISGSQVDPETGQLISMSLESRSFLQDAGAGFIRIVGAEANVSLAGLGSLQSRTVYTPPSVNVEFSIQPSQTINKSSNSTTSLTLPVGPPSVGVDNSVSSYTFVGRESITVRGRTYATCKYTQRATSGDTGAASFWFIDGKGVPARIEEADTFGTTTRTSVIELVSGTLNGAPL